MAGRPTKFNSALSAKIAALYGAGKTDKEVANSIGVSLRTIQYWKASQPEFLHSLKEGKDVADELVISSLFRRATGYTHPEEKIFQYEGKIIRAKTAKHYPPDVTAAIFWLKNRRPDEWRESNAIAEPEKSHEIATNEPKSFEQFCVDADYPPPYPKQIEMMRFGFENTEPRLLLGARGTGKSDYVTIMGTAYSVYRDPTATNLIMSKSKERNSAMLAEIATALTKNGIVLEKQNSNQIRIEGLLGKDHSVSAVTIKTVSLRGRHPKRVVMDDCVTEDDTSEATRLLVEKKYSEVLKLTSNVCIIGQPCHKHDLYAKLRPLVKKMEVIHGEIPELMHDLEAMKLAGVDEHSIRASYFLEIVNDGSIPFDKIRYIDKYPVGDSVAFIDPSHEGGDYTALAILRQYMDGVAVVGFAWKMAWNHALDAMVPKLKQYGVRKLCFETNALGDMPIEILGQALRGTGIGIVGRKSTTNKHSRIMAAGAHAQFIHLAKESDKQFIDQIVNYEYKAKHDDCPDALASCLCWIGLVRGKD